MIWFFLLFPNWNYMSQSLEKTFQNPNLNVCYSCYEGYLFQRVLEIRSLIVYTSY